MYHLKIALRNIFKQKLNNSIIVISLAIGIACISLIAVYLIFELKTDDFIPDKENIYALTNYRGSDKDKKYYICSSGVANYLEENFPQIEEHCFFGYGGTNKVIIDNKEISEHIGLTQASDNFFRFFGYQFVYGNPETALKSENDIVISDEIALTLFGTTDAVNKAITCENRNGTNEYIISGVFKKPKENSHIRPHLVILKDLEYAGTCRNYFRIKPNASVDNLKSAINANDKSISKITGQSDEYFLVPLKEIYFDPDFGLQRDKKDLWSALIIGAIVLLIATFNYLGITNSKLNSRIRDYKIQRINGSSHQRFIMNFMIENLILILVSILVSLLFVKKLVPLFGQFTGSYVFFEYTFDGYLVTFLLILIVFLLLVTFLFVIQRIKVNITFTSLSSGMDSSLKLFKIPAFSIFQLVSTVVFIVCSFVILKQINYISNKPLGYDKNVISVTFPYNSNIRKDKMQVFKEELLRNPMVKSASIGLSPLDRYGSKLSYERDGNVIDFVPSIISGDSDFIKTTGIKVIKGNDVIKDFPLKNQCLVSESFLKLFPNEDLIGSKLPIVTDDSDIANLTVVGVVEDLYSNFVSEVEPLIIVFGGLDFRTQLLVKTNSSYSASVETINQIWNNLGTGVDVDILTLGYRFDRIHNDNKRLLKPIALSCIVSIFLSMIGLFAISVQDTQKRTKEIGIRKVNGAKIVEILALLNKDFAMWSLTAIIIATPIAYYLMNKWLETFAYKTELSWWVFALSGLLALGIALLTVSFQSWRAATRNPVEALRYE